MFLVESKVGGVAYRNANNHPWGLIPDVGGSGRTAIRTECQTPSASAMVRRAYLRQISVRLSCRAEADL